MNPLGIAAVATAIGLCQPALSVAERRSYAQIIVEGAGSIGVDPVALVALVDHETGWKAHSISPDGEDFGLGQIRARYRPQCARERNPLHHPSPRCAAEKRRLLNGRHNLRVMINIVGMWRKQCKEQVDTETEAGWMQAYGGWNRPTLGVVCGRRLLPPPTPDGTAQVETLPVPSAVQWILDRQQQLHRSLSPRT